MKIPRNIILAVVGALILLVIYNAAYTVNEKEQVIITQFGKPVGEPIVEAGIHFLLPFIQKPNFFDKRFLEWDGIPNEVPTKDKRFVRIDTYGRWRINDPLLFFQRVRNERSAQSRLDDILNGETRNAIAQHEVVEIIRSTNREAEQIEGVAGEEESDVLQKIKAGRNEITLSILKAAAPRAAEIGIELLDLRFKRINYHDQDQKKIFERMITERKRIADKFRSEGQGDASRIIGNKERDLKRIESGAYKAAEEIKGKADAEATAIYASAYNRNAETRDFYRFLKTMETYENVLSEKDWLILSTESDFFRYLRNPQGR